MTSRLSDFVLTLSHACSRRRLPHAWRRMHQAVARAPASQPTPVSGFSSDYLHGIYEDLMALEHAQARTSYLRADSQVQAPKETVDGLLSDYAKRGNIQEFESAVSRMLPGRSLLFCPDFFFIDASPAPPTEHQRDLHVKAHIVSASLSTHPSTSTTQRFPTSALAVLHQYEASGHFAPIKSYTRVISALFNVQTNPSSDPGLGRAAAQAQAWDLFAHMRYVAHPVPDAHLYALMIRACGSFSRPEPERALDLWLEMQENRIEPTKGAYEAVIRVCCKGGPEWLGEGMRLAREMSDQYSITGMSGRGLWCALLEGCKRSGDLNKARWILAEAVRGSSDVTNNEDSMVDAELMTHVFHTYASYKTPFRREATRFVERSTTMDEEVSAKETQAEKISSHTDSSPPEQTQHGDIPIESIESIPSFSRFPPQTPSDVIAETRALFGRILQDRSVSTEEARRFCYGGPLVGRFAHVELTPVLLNAYLSVFYRHASIETSQEVLDSLFNKSHSSSALVLRLDEHTYVNALERCAMAPTEERRIAAQWAEDIWRRWEEMEAKGLRYGKGDVGSFARLIERAHAAMRRVLIL